MNTRELEKNIIDLLEEQQLKLGYMSGAVRLYYPLTTLNRFLETDYDADEMQEYLFCFIDQVKERLGALAISHEGERFCLVIPKEGVDYVHAKVRPDSFMADLIRTVGTHGCTLEDVLKQFYRHSERVHVEQMNHEEFDYLVYFEDGVPDSFRYCITLEECHVTYHRFTKEDFEEFGF